MGGVGWGGVGGPCDFSVTPVQTESQELGVRSFEFRVRSLEFVWTSSGLSLDNINPESHKQTTSSFLHFKVQLENFIITNLKSFKYPSTHIKETSNTSSYKLYLSVSVART